MRAGSATSVLRFPTDFFPVEGFSRLLDDLHARVLVLEQEKRVALLVLELTSVPPDEIHALSDILRQTTQADTCRVLVTHTFSAPHFRPDKMLMTPADQQKKQQLRELIYTATHEAASEAVSRMQAVSVHIGMASCQVNTPRDVETPDGWWVLNNGEGSSDERMTVLRLLDAEKKSVAAMVHYAVQSSVLDGSQLKSGGKAVSGDLGGLMAASLEKEWGCPVLFLIGAAGDQAPRQKAVGFRWENGAMVATDMQDEAIPVCRVLAQEMAEAALTAAAVEQPAQADLLLWDSRTVSVPTKQMERDLKKLHPTRIPPYEPDGEATQPVELLQIGSLKLVGVKPELNCVTAQEISGNDPMVRVVTLWNGGAKYMADAASYDRITYESQNSPFMKGAAEQLCAAAKELLEANRV